MGVIFKLAIRNMRRRKARYILTTVTLVIGVALFGGILIARDSFKVMFVKDIDNRMGTADLLIRESETQDGWFTERKLEDIADLPHVEYVSYRIAGFSVYSSIAPEGNLLDNSTRTAVYGIDIESSDEKKLGGTPHIIDSDVSGDTIEELLDHNGKLIVITEALQIQLGNDVKAGDEIRVLPVDYHLKLGYTEEERTYVDNNIALWPQYKIAAIVRDLGEARDFDPETPETYSQPSSGPCIFVKLEIAHELVDGIVNREGYYTLAAVGVDDVNNAEDVADDIEDELGDDFWVVADLKTDMIEDINDSVDMMMTLLMMFAIVALILSIILILNILNIIKQEQEYETGMLQAVGASKSETFKMFLIQGIIMGIIGAVVGTICSFFMSYFIFFITVESLKNMPGVVGEMFAETEFEIMLYPETLAITMSVGFFSCVLASLYPSWKASRKPLIECLNPLGKKSEREKKQHKKKIVYLILASLLIAVGSYLLFTMAGYGPREGEHDLNESTISIIAPTLILLGVIGITAIFVGPISRGFITLFSPYLKKTKLLTKKNVLRHRKRTVLTYSMISLTVSYLIGVSIIMGSFREGVHTTVNDVMGCDIRIFVGGASRSLEVDLKDVDGVDDVMGASHQNALLWHEDKNEWIGHYLLEKNWEKSVSVHIMDTGEVEQHMINTKILDPEDMTLEEMMDDLSDLNTMIITEKEADYFDLDVDDEIDAQFTLGITYPSIADLIANDRDNAIEDTVITKMKVIAIVEKFQGFATGEIIGQEEGAFNIYISWETYEQIAKNNLFGGNTDLILRQKTQSGDEKFDAAQPNWFNFSDVYSTLEGINGIKYYTTRMDYISPTFDYALPYNPLLINLGTSVVGLRTNYTNIIQSDNYFGSHSFVNKSNDVTGSKIETLLNRTENVCVVDQTYVDNMRVNNPAFGINSSVAIFPQQFQKLPDTILTAEFNTNVTATNGTIDPLLSSENLLMVSDNNRMKLISNKSYFEAIITVNMTYYMYHFIQPYNITLESYVNSTIDNLILEVFNDFTSSYELLGRINSTVEKNHIFTFNQYMPPFSYINQSNFLLKLRIRGSNSTYDNDYSVFMDKLSFLVLNSTYSLNPKDPFNPWPQYRVVGIIRDPLLYRTERYNWLAGSESYIDIAETENAVYISYDKARTQVYNNYNGTMINGSNDKITHVYIHCDSVDDIKSSYSSLRSSFDNNWTIVDLKSDIYDFRTYAFDWYIWVEEGEDDEEVLEELVDYLEDHGYAVYFAFTNSYITEIFESMIDLITLIMNGILVFAIVIAMIGLALHCLLTTMARRREIGMLRSIGLNKKGIIRTISGETLIVSFLGTVIGILAGILTGVLMVASIPDTGFLTVTLTIPWLTMGILVLVTLVVAILSSRYPSRWAANINIIDAVRTR
ncbi:MAG: ABC transporter permease [Promethearchaeota archaeon]